MIFLKIDMWIMIQMQEFIKNWFKKKLLKSKWQIFAIFFSASSEWRLLDKIASPENGNQQQLPKNGLFCTYLLEITWKWKEFWSLRCRIYQRQVRSRAKERCQFRGRYFFKTGELFVTGEHNHSIREPVNSEEICSKGIFCFFFLNIRYVFSIKA